jgi:hypothetical protein
MGTKSRFQEIVWSESQELLTARDVRRCIQLASVLEPMSEKDGCTTRTKDSSDFQKLEYFLSAGINIGDAFEDLASRIQHDGFPCMTYDLCYRAQADSKKNRRGGRVNQGIIEFLFPIVISQISYQHNNAYSILDNVLIALEKTTPTDADWLQRMQNLAFEMSGYYQRIFPVKEYSDILSYYNTRLENSIKPSDKYHNNELVSNYPTLRYMIEFSSNYGEQALSKSMQFVYDEIRQKKPELPVGIIADLIVCLIYLNLSCDRNYKHVR